MTAYLLPFPLLSYLPSRTLSPAERILSLESSLAREKEENTSAQIKLVLAELEKTRWETEAQAQSREIVALNDQLISQKRLVERYREIEALMRKWE